MLKSVRDIMRKDKGLNHDLDRIPLLTWIMFLKFLDDQERIREAEARVSNVRFQPVIEAPYRWRDWAAKHDGITGPELRAFIIQDEAVRPDGTKGPGLFAHLKSLSGVESYDQRHAVAIVFRGVENKMVSGYLLRDVINKIDEIHFEATPETHTLAFLYESLLKEMRDAAGDAGEFYTPRPVIKFIVGVVNPRLGETVLDPAAGTGGFLIEAFNHLKAGCRRVEDFDLLQKRTLNGFEAKPMPYLLCQMNMLLHGIEFPQIDPDNALRFPLREIGEKERFDIIMTNPPFGGEEERGILGNFPEDKRATETSLLFLQLIMRRLRRVPNPGRAGVIVPNGILFGTGTYARVKEDLLRDFNLHTIVRLPEGVFAPYAGIPTNILFFESRGPTRDIWYYEIPEREGGGRYSRSKPITLDKFTDCLKWWVNRVENKQAWKVSAMDIENDGHNLDRRNPRADDEIVHEAPEVVLGKIMLRENRMLETMQQVQDLLHRKQ